VAGRYGSLVIEANIDGFKSVRRAPSGEPIDPARSKEWIGMLVLSRQRDESIIIGDNIVITIVDIRGDKVRLGIEAPTEISVHRQEVYELIQRENAQGRQSEQQNSSRPNALNRAKRRR
jgi:carbon storage regulator